MNPLKTASIALIASTLCGCPKKQPAATGVVDPSADNVVSAAVRGKIRVTLTELETACKAHNAKEGQPPADLQALIDGGMWHDHDRKDPWGRDWVLVVAGNDVTVWCYGKDGVPGGEGANEDYKSH